MDNDLAHQAVAAAISGDWKKALEINKKILKSDPLDTDALNRLARAHAENGSLPTARSTAKKVLKIDPFNKIAQKSLAKWKSISKKSNSSSGTSSANMFLEEPGKTKIVSLIHLGSSRERAIIASGDEVKINALGHRISICTEDGKYLGRFPDDLSGHFKRLIGKGNEYKAFIKSVTPEEVKVFVKEVKRGKQGADIPSFV